MRLLAAGCLLVLLVAPAVSQADDLGDARRLTEQRRFEQALPLYERLVRARPGDADLLIEAGRAHAWDDRHDRAVQLYLRAIEVAPARRADVSLPLAWQLLWSGQPKAAMPYFKEAARILKQRRDARHGLAESYVALEKYGEALEIYAELAESDPADLRARHGRARMLLWLDRLDEAEREYQAILRSRPEDEEARVGLARGHNWAGRHRQAAAEYRALVREDPGSPGLRADLATALRWGGFDDHALDALEGVPGAPAAELRGRIQRDVADTFTASWNYSSDSDDLQIRTLELDNRYWFDFPRSLGLNYRRSALDQTVDGEGVQVTGQQLLVGLGDRWGDVDSPAGAIWPSAALGVRNYGDWTSLAWRLRAKWLPADLWRVDFDAGNEVIENVRAVENEVRFDSLNAGFDYQFAPRWRAGAGAGLGRFDDGNVRSRVNGRLEYLTFLKPRLTLGVAANAFNDSDQVDPYRGYYNPEAYREYQFTVGLEAERLGWEMAFKGGLGRIHESPGGSSSLDNWEANVGRDLNDRTRLFFYLGQSDSTAQFRSSSGGYSRKYGGLGFKFFY